MKGFSLIEVVISAAILVIIIFTFTLLFQQSKWEQIASFDRFYATIKARELLTELELTSIRLQPENLPSTGNQWVQINEQSSSFFNFDPSIRSASRFELSPLKSNYGLFFRITNLGGSDQRFKKLEVQVRWTVNSTKYNRNILMQLIVGPTLSEPFA